MRRRCVSHPRSARNPKLCQELRQRPPMLTSATDAGIQHFRRWPTPTDAINWLPGDPIGRRLSSNLLAPSSPTSEIERRLV